MIQRHRYPMNKERVTYQTFPMRPIIANPSVNVYKRNHQQVTCSVQNFNGWNRKKRKRKKKIFLTVNRPRESKSGTFPSPAHRKKKKKKKHWHGLFSRNWITGREQLPKIINYLIAKFKLITN